MSTSSTVHRVGTQGQGMELLLHPGDEYLGSLEPDSLQVLAYVKLYMPDTKMVTMTASCIPMQFPKERPPFLRVRGSIVASGAEQVITYLQEQFAVEDTSGQDEVAAYSALLTDRFLPAMLYSKWLNSQNYIDFTRSSYAKILYFPVTLFYLSWQHRAVGHLIMRGAPPDLTLEQRGLELMSKAEECVGLLSARLGEHDYFCGDHSSSLDIRLFGYLEQLLQSPHCEADPVSKSLRTHGNLVLFCQRMRKSLFPEIKARSSEGVSLPTMSGPTSLWRDSALWISVGVATTVLCVQAVRVGLFQQLS
ncbi:metaxin-3-like [Halichondria panicea]|uniref:metaxin-3-like n=1 Tax=Halichondria panicea TaxID=6063 RepID=UPI00312B8312